MNAAWWYLLGAGILEVCWAIGLKYTDGFSRLWPSVLTLACMAASFWLLSGALRTLPVGTAYAVWTGIGAVGTALVGILLLGEPLNLVRVAGIAAIAGGIVTLKVAG